MIGAAGVWALAFALSLLALALMLGLVAYRAFANRLLGVRGGERRRYIELLKSHAEAERETAADDVLTDLSVQILELVRGEGSAALVATHNERLAAKMDRVVRLHEGVLV